MPPLGFLRHVIAASLTEYFRQTTVTEFLLMGFSEDHNVQIVHFVVFLSIYLIALMGNFLIITAVALNYHLHTPMYIFLVNLSLIDICYISTIVPKTMAISLTSNKLISFSGCVAQVFLVLTFAGAELALLTVMAYDRYVAICHPLQYKVMISSEACIQMAAASWVSSVIHAVLETTITFRLSFCRSNVIGQFFCDISQLQKISCSDTQFSHGFTFSVGLLAGSFCFVFIFISYGYIFSAVLKIPADQGRYKVFSTCTPHLTVFSFFIITAMFVYLRPNGPSSPTVDLLSAILYTVLPPVLNPIIYSLRNKDIQEAVRKITKKCKLHSMIP
ncbi:olfactory receptor 14A16-like [Rhineura floridana]|uniref:olfactory receptor 14A16-like n=1 Tax=Rhineura floridana TaxID=261503 RepID=UPI002AC838C6|nr:olfactory receptor 14A16-like [Rhineura floridana]